MPDEERTKVKRGPIALLLLLVGLLLGSAGGVGLSLEIDGSSSQLRQTRPAKSAIALRTEPRASSADDEDRGDPLVPSLPSRIVDGTAAAYPAARRVTAEAVAPKRPLLTGYRARAPPAA